MSISAAKLQRPIARTRLFVSCAIVLLRLSTHHRYRKYQDCIGFRLGSRNKPTVTRHRTTNGGMLLAEDAPDLMQVSLALQTEVVRCIL
jgi:hypothetical protein